MLCDTVKLYQSFHALLDGLSILTLDLFSTFSPLGILNNYQDKSVCQSFFDNYKVCRKEEHKRILDERGRNPKSLF